LLFGDSGPYERAAFVVCQLKKDGFHGFAPQGGPIVKSSDDFPAEHPQGIAAAQRNGKTHLGPGREIAVLRQRSPFPVPGRAWFRSEFRPMLDKFVLGERSAARGLFEADFLRRLVQEHSAGSADHTERLWPLVNSDNSDHACQHMNPIGKPYPAPVRPTLAGVSRSASRASPAR
jgi:hypothetical protein